MLLVQYFRSRGSRSESVSSELDAEEKVLELGYLAIMPFVFEALCGERNAGENGEVGGAIGEVGVDIVRLSICWCCELSRV